jgi:hypothetical protein
MSCATVGAADVVRPPRTRCGRLPGRRTGGRSGSSRAGRCRYIRAGCRRRAPRHVATNGCAGPVPADRPCRAASAVCRGDGRGQRTGSVSRPVRPCRHGDAGTAGAGAASRPDAAPIGQDAAGTQPTRPVSPPAAEPLTTSWGRQGPPPGDRGRLLHNESGVRSLRAGSSRAAWSTLTSTARRSRVSVSDLVDRRLRGRTTSHVHEGASRCSRCGSTGSRPGCGSASPPWG